MDEYNMWIGGKWVAAESGGRFDLSVLKKERQWDLRS